MNKFYFSTRGDRTIGDYGHAAEVTFAVDVPASEIKTVSRQLQEAFEEIWNDDVAVYTEDDMNAPEGDDNVCTRHCRLYCPECTSTGAALYKHLKAEP